MVNLSVEVFVKDLKSKYTTKEAFMDYLSDVTLQLEVLKEHSMNDYLISIKFIDDLKPIYDTIV